MSGYASVVFAGIRGRLKYLQLGHFEVLGRLESGRKARRQAEQQLVLGNNVGTTGGRFALLDYQAPIPHCEARHPFHMVADDIGVRQIFRMTGVLRQSPNPHSARISAKNQSLLDFCLLEAELL